jgi:hypothetical protein
LLKQAQSSHDWLELPATRVADDRGSQSTVRSSCEERGNDVEAVNALAKRASDLTERLAIQDELTRHLIRRLAQIEWDRPATIVDEG